VLVFLQQQLKLWMGMGSNESGLTLIELLISMLLISIMASIALPSFSSHVSKARDTRAKGAAQEAAIAVETCMVESGGLYSGCDLESLRSLDPALPDSPTLKVNIPKAGTSYTLKVRSEPSSQVFTVKRSAKGMLTFPCTSAGSGACPAGGKWG
jgi:type IV pilus assembly protein PilE